MASSDRMLSPACSCGKPMRLAASHAMPARDETHIDIFHCAACGHEMRVTVWGEERLTNSPPTRPLLASDFTCAFPRPQ